MLIEQGFALESVEKCLALFANVSQDVEGVRYLKETLGEYLETGVAEDLETIMASVDALKEMLLPICVITVVSTVLIMIVTGRVSQHIIRGQKNKGAAAMQTVGTEAAADDKEDR